MQVPQQPTIQQNFRRNLTFGSSGASHLMGSHANSNAFQGMVANSNNFTFVQPSGAERASPTKNAF